MRYICEEGHIFEHTAKAIFSNVGLTVGPLQSLTAIVEIPICPICQTARYSEYVLDKKSVVSVISVDLAEVDSKLKEGYEVEALYAKTATLVKKEDGKP